VSGSAEREDAQIEAEIRSLDADARLVLAALAVTGRGSLTEAELHEITGIPDVRIALAELERRALLVRESGDRFRVPPAKQSRLKRLLASADVIDRALRGFIRIAEDGRLTLDDLDAVVELTRIAAATGHWADLLRLAETAQTSLSVTHRVEEWVEIVERRLEAARAVGDGDSTMRAEEELDRLARRPGSAGGEGATDERRVAARSGGRGARWALAALGATAIAAAGVAAGFAIGDEPAAGDVVTETTTELSTETETDTETTTETVTTAGDTVTETETVTTTETVVTTVVG
jgi:hypothetical protein